MSEIFGGIDIGQQNIKVILINSEGKIMAKYAEHSADEAVQASQKALAETFHLAGLNIKELAFLVITGTGKEKTGHETKTVSSADSYALGARYFHPTARTVVDMGAEGIRVVRIDDRGMVLNLVENSKCAAGSGIFLDEMAAALEVATLDEACRLSQEAARREKINTICVVFAESEVVSAVHRGVPKAEIIAGIHDAVAERAAVLVMKCKPQMDVVLAGGMARNKCLVDMLEEKIGFPLLVPEDPHLIGALGAALKARELFNEKLETGEGRYVGRN